MCNCYLQVFKGEKLQNYTNKSYGSVFCTSSNDSYICMKFQEDIFNGFYVKHIHDFVTEQLLTSSKRNN